MYPISTENVIKKTKELYRQKVSDDAGFSVDVTLSRQVTALGEVLTKEFNERIAEVVKSVVENRSAG